MTENTQDMSSCKRLVALHMVNGADVASVCKTAVEMHLLDLGQIAVFSSEKTPEALLDGIMWIEFPGFAGTSPKQKNFIIDWCKMKSFKGFLHMVESSIKFNTSTKSYMDKLETAMSVLDYSIHLSTKTDKCNYVFSKFSPRLTLEIDDDAVKQKLGLPDKICFTSHSNVSYVTYDFGKLADCPMKFDERFTVGMFYIIEFLARRRKNREDGQLYYMNQYLSIGDEVNAYDVVEQPACPEIDDKKMQEENELFKSIGVDYTPDNNVDIVLDAFYKKIKSKLA